MTNRGNSSSKPRKSMFVPVLLFAAAWFLIWMLSVVPADFFLLTFLAVAATGVTVAAFVTGWARLGSDA